MRNYILITALLVAWSTGCHSANPRSGALGAWKASQASEVIVAKKSTAADGNSHAHERSISARNDESAFDVGLFQKAEPASQTSKTAQGVAVSTILKPVVSSVSFEQPLPNAAGAEDNNGSPGTDSVGLAVAREIEPQFEAAQYETFSDLTSSIDGNSFPIDLPTVLQLAGADNLNVKIAREKVCEAQANYSRASAAWLPTLNFGVGYNQHEGEIQATPGDVSTNSRGSLFVGGGATIGNQPLAGGSGGPLRLTADLSIADAIFRPLAARQIVKAERQANSKVFNDVMLESALAYFDLAEAQSQSAVAMLNQQDAEELYRLTSAFVQGGKGTDADSSRMQVVVNQAQLSVVERRAAMGLASAELARVLQLDATKLDSSLGIYANEPNIVPIDLVDRSIPVDSLVSSALMTRCDIAEAESRAQAAKTRVELEKARPLLPYLHVGYSGGVFGGGQGSSLQKLDGRGDLDIQLTWELQNLGAGTRALKEASRSQFNQSVYSARAVKDQIEKEVTEAFLQVNLYAETRQLAEANVAEATNALEKNVIAIKGLEGLPLAAVQSIQALAQARSEYLQSVMNYNRWQLRLIRAIGQPIAEN